MLTRNCRFVTRKVRAVSIGVGFVACYMARGVQVFYLLLVPAFPASSAYRSEVLTMVERTDPAVIRRELLRLARAIARGNERRRKLAAELRTVEDGLRRDNKLLRDLTEDTAASLLVPDDPRESPDVESLERLGDDLLGPHA